MREWWTQIFCRDKEAMQKVDRVTVKALECKAPGACRADRESLHRQVRSGKIFGAFTDQEREVIWRRVLAASTDRLIPSLFSFFEDSVNYLQGPAECIKTLIEPLPGETLTSALERSFSDANQVTDHCVIQQSESTFITIPGTLSDRLNFGCRQLWLGAKRNYVEMPTQKEDDSLLAKPRSKPSETTLYEFACLAYRLGFKSDRIHELIKHPPDEKIARNALLEARRPGRYRYDAAVFSHFVEQIIGFFATAQEITEEDIAEADWAQRPPKRCGIPETGGYRTDKRFLFLKKLHTTNVEQVDEMTSFFIRRSVYFAFFGKLDRGEQDRLAGQTRPAEQERLQQERRERELKRQRLEQERQRAEQERLEQERFEQERLEQERLEQERLEQERLEQERLEQERLEQERLEQERLERENIERKKRIYEKKSRREENKKRQEYKRITQINLDELKQSEAQEPILHQNSTTTPGEYQTEQILENADEQSHSVSDTVDLEQERLEQERLEQERLARERQEKLEQERLARERQEKLKQERLEQERLARERLAREGEKKKQQVTSSPASIKKNQKRITQVNFNKLAESVAKGTIPHIERQTGQVQDVTTFTSASNPERTTQQKIKIYFKIQERGNERLADTIIVNLSDQGEPDTGELKRVAAKYIRKNTKLCDKNGDDVKPGTCFEAAITGGENTLYLIPTQNNGNAEYAVSIRRDKDLEPQGKRLRPKITTPVPVKDPPQIGLLKK